MTIADLTEAARKLRLRKAPVRFRPRLIYLVETTHGYVHPNHTGYVSGQEAWTSSYLWFQCHKDASDFAKTRPPLEKATVLKLNLCAFPEPIIKSKPQ